MSEEPQKEPQILPAVLADMLVDADSRKTERVKATLLSMKQLDIAALHRAFEGA